MRLLNKIPLIQKYKQKLNEKFQAIDKEMTALASENIALRIRLKILEGKKITVVFVCWRPSIWGSLKTVYDALKADSFFDVKIVTIPNKKQLPELDLSHEMYESEGAEDFWHGCDVLAGYNYETGEWLNIRSLKADYICFQQPYDICRTDTQKSWLVSQYAKIFYVAYYAFFSCNETNFVNDECTPLGFMQNVSLFFTQNDADQAYMQKRMEEAGNTNVKVVMTGFPRYDALPKTYDDAQTAWNFKYDHSRFRLIWTPRWDTSEHNCHFFDYKDKLIDYCKDNDDIDFVFRPHPQAFLNWVASGEFPESEAERFKTIYAQSANMTIDTSGEFLPTFYTADCMISDTSSVVPEFFLTGNPIIYCHKKGSINSFAKDKGYTSGFYWAENWSDVVELLDMLRSGKDPLRTVRQELIKKYFYIPEQGAGNAIKEYIKQDAFGNL